MFTSEPPQKSCVALYRQRVGTDVLTYSPNTEDFYLAHSDGRVLKLSGSDRVRLNDGRAVLWKRVAARPGAPGKETLRLANNPNIALLHFNYEVYAHTIDENNGDFYWNFVGQPDGKLIVESAFQGGGWVLGYDIVRDQARIVQRANDASRVVSWEVQTPEEDLKDQHKALAMMTRGHGIYQGTLEAVEACVLPAVARNTINASAGCAVRDSVGIQLNNTMINTARGNLDMDRTVAENQVRRGQGVYPAGGCAVVNTDQPAAFRQTVKDAGEALSSENNRILTSLASRLGNINNTNFRFRNEWIPAAQERLRRAAEDDERATNAYRTDFNANQANVIRWRSVWERLTRARDQFDGWNAHYDRQLDRARSLHRLKTEACNAARQRASSQRVVMFQHCGYQGWGQQKWAGVRETENTNWWQSWMRWRDRWYWDSISSITVPAGLQVTIFDQPNYRGNSAVLTSSQWCLVNVGGRNFNDRVKSYIVDFAIHPPPRLDPPAKVLYQRTRF